MIITLVIPIRAEVKITLDDPVWEKWANEGFQGKDIAEVDEDRKQVLIHESRATIENLAFSPNERGLIHVGFNLLEQESTRGRFDFHVIQRNQADNSVIGGELFQVVVPSRQPSTTEEEAADNEREFDLISLSPNPASTKLNVKYKAVSAELANLMIVKHFGNISNQYEYALEVNLSTVQIDISSYESGTYTVILICNDEITDYMNLSIQ